MEMCARCRSPIYDRYLMRVGDRSVHESCLGCSLCSRPLAARCFIKDDLLLCPADYARLRTGQCSACGKTVEATEYVIRARNWVYHEKCLRCHRCLKQMQKGDKFVVTDGMPRCYNECSSAPIHDEVLISSAGADDERCCSTATSAAAAAALEAAGGAECSGCEMLSRLHKRPRTILTPQQRKRFKAAFDVTPKPNKKVRDSLASETGLPVRVVQVWFQNQRAKIKKGALATCDARYGGSWSDAATGDADESPSCATTGAKRDDDASSTSSSSSDSLGSYCCIGGGGLGESLLPQPQQQLLLPAPRPPSSFALLPPTYDGACSFSE